MALDLTQLATNVATVTVPFGDTTIDVRYRPSVATPSRMQAVSNMGPDDDEMGVFVDFMADLLVGWDIVKSGASVPVTPEGISTVPMSVLQKVMTGVMADASNVGEAGSSSSDG